MKKILSITFLFIISIGAIAQELDEDFLKTLPKGMQDDVLNRVKEQDKNEDPAYRSIKSQTEIEKRDLKTLKERLEKDLDFLEKKLEDDNKLSEKLEGLPIYGSDFFRTYQSTYMPINEPNLSPNYILDSGDVLSIQLTGSKDFIEKIPVNRDGSINFPEIGRIKLAGLSLGEASNLIKSKVNESFIGTEAFVSLDSVRDINVLVSGNAFNPGIYTISGNSNMLHALAVAGGINETGSYREINLVRDQKIIETLDMYDVLISGLYDSGVSLRTGDVIFVTSLKNTVSIDGAVKVPAKYELEDGQNLYQVIDYARGITVDADLENIYLNRILDGRLESLPIRNIKQFQNISSKDGDAIFIRKYPFRSVFIDGAVLKPGNYVMAEGESINDLLEKAGGYTKNAYPFGAIYQNDTAFEINKMAKEKLYGEFIDSIITASQKTPESKIDLQSIVQLTESLYNSEPNGRVVVDLLSESFISSMSVRDGDKLTIPEKPDHVYIYGEVSYEGALKYEKLKSLEHYLEKSGGLKENADYKAIYVLHPNGDTQRTSIKRNLFQNSPDDELVLHPGSIIFVPRGIDDTATTRLAAQAYVSILGNIGIALASLSSIKD